MKSKISQATRKTVSLLLAILMMFSMLTVGITTVSAAQTFNSVNLVGIIKGAKNWETQDYPFTYSESTGNWTLTVELNKGDSVKARANNAWTTSFGSNNGNISITESDTYTFTIADNAANGTDLTVQKGASGGGDTTEIQNWYMVCWYPNCATSWGISDDRKIDGDTGSITLNTTSTSTCYFRMVAKLADGTYYTYKVANSKLSVGVSQTLVKDTQVSNTSSANVGTELQISPTDTAKPYKTFAVTKDGDNYVLTVTQSETDPSVEPTTEPTTVETTTVPVTTTDYYLYYWNGSANIPTQMTYADGVYSITIDSSFLVNDRKVKIADTDDTNTFDNAQHSVNYNSPTVLVSDAASAAGITAAINESSYKDLVIGGTETDLVIEFVPNADNALKGTITVKLASEIGGGTTPTIKLTADKTSLELADGAATATLTTEITNADGVTPTYAVTKGGSSTTDASVSADGTTFTATEIGTYKVTATITVDGKEYSSSVEITVKTAGAPSFAEDGRIYVYAGADATNPQSDAWVAAEKVADPQPVYHNNDMQSGAEQYPSLGAASESSLRVFLPTSASTTQIVIYNAFSSNITVGGVTIEPGKIGTVPYKYSSGVSLSVTGAATKTIKVYKSEAQGALYINNTGSYAGYSNDGIPNMLPQLYSGKDSGKIGKGNSGAISDGNTVTNVEVEKIKGRGNSTWINTDKKSFNVTYNKAISAFGFNGKKFSLLANFKDPSLSRNKILYALGDYDYMGVKYSPDVATVDLYMNGLYMGNYLMCQKVDIGKTDLISDAGVVDNLAEDLYADATTGKLTAASADSLRNDGFSFLIELDSNPAAGADYYTTVGSQKITIKEPEYIINTSDPSYVSAVDSAIKDFIKGKYGQLVSALDSGSKTDLEAIIDIDSLARFMMLNELAKNFDFGVSSCYFVYNKAEGKFYASPVWDMDVTTGNCKESNSQYQSYEGDWSDKNSDYNYLMKKVFANANVIDAVKSFWTVDFYNGLVAEIDKLAAGAKTDGAGSFAMNNLKWTQPYNFQGKYKDDVQAKTSLTPATYERGTYTVASTANPYDSSVEGQISYVADWLKSRAAWLTSQYATYDGPTETLPAVTLKGSAIDNADIKDGTPVTLTATVTPATKNGAVVTGDYTVDFYRGETKIGTETVTFTAEDTAATTKTVTYATTLASTNDVFKATVSADGTTYTATSNETEYKQEGIKDKKIYFDPSVYVINDVAEWTNATTKDSVVTVTVGDATFTMTIDTDDVHGLDKGVFKALVDADTLALLQNSSDTITFSMDGTDLTASVSGNASIDDGWIYNYSSEEGQALWEPYNVSYVTAYPKSDITTYQQFEEYLKAQYENNTDNIVYFDNSASKWYNVYIYDWSGTELSVHQMSKLPYADIWYYDFGDTAPQAKFLFKDRGDIGFGSNYQQTVDLVDGYVLNGNSEQVTLNFASTISTSNPIFVTANFYNCTINQNSDTSSKTLKYRAFNTEWQDFATVVAASVKTTAVDVYFDFHGINATDIALYHTSTNDTFTFATAFTRLTRLPGSTIYHATIQLPYTVDENGNISIAFKFDKFVVNNGNSTEYTMSDAVQPSASCITTNEVWYEFGTNASDNCGILGYTHSTATFESTTGGQIDSAYVTLTNGYSGDNQTGYATTVDGVTTVIYAIPTEKADATTSFGSVTSAADSNYKFTGWSKDDSIMTGSTTKLADGVTSSAPVSYVANWSEVEEKTYTFTYSYEAFDTSAGVEYDANRDKVTNSDYKVTVNIKENATAADILAEFLKRAPHISSDYFNYTFDHLTVNDISIDGTALTVTGSAKITGNKTYNVVVKDLSGSVVTNNSYFYQNIITVTNENQTEGKVTVWKDEATGAILAYGQSYKFRAARNVTLTFEEIDSKDVIEERTVVNEPTYEFYTKNGVQKVRFNFLVENFVPADTTVTEYGVLYFFTDKDGAPVDKTVAQDSNISADTLVNAAKGGVDGVTKYDATAIVNNKNRYIFAPSISYTTANTDRYLRVFSYYIKADGTVVTSDPTSIVLGSIRNAIS